MNNKSRMNGTSEVNQYNAVRKSAMWGEIVEVLKSLPCFSQEKYRENFDYTVAQFYNLLSDPPTNPTNLNKSLENLFNEEFRESPVVIDVADTITTLPKNTPFIAHILKRLFTVRSPTFNPSINISGRAYSQAFMQYVGNNTKFYEVRNRLLSLFKATYANLMDEAFKKLSQINPPEKSVVTSNNASSNNGLNNATIVPPPFQPNQNLYPLENNDSTVTGGAKKRKQRELLKTKTVEQLRRMMRRAGKKCSRKGVALRKSQLISALLH